MSIYHTKLYTMYKKESKPIINLWKFNKILHFSFIFLRLFDIIEKNHMGRLIFNAKEAANDYAIYNSSPTCTYHACWLQQQ